MSFSSEPAVWVAVATALLSLAIGFGLPVSPDQKTLIVAALTVAAGVVIRSQVTPVAKVVVPIGPLPPAG